MLNVIVFVCGAALMALEIVAARVLAPALGNSIFVWGSVISIVMVALSLGYWLGGQLADRRRPARALAPVIAAAGVLTVLAPVIAAAVLPWAADLGPRLGSLVASALIFFAPALLLAMVSPLGVRLATSSDIERVGRSAGGLYSVSTAGSIVGTLATSFWLIPAAVSRAAHRRDRLLAVRKLAGRARPVRSRSRAAHPASGRFTAVRSLAPSRLVVVGAMLGGWVLLRVAPAQATNAKGERVLYRADTQYHRLTVTEGDGVRHLRFDASNQSAIDLSDGYTSTIAYPNYLDLALACKPDAKRVLVLGLGGGAVTKRWWRDYPDMTIDTVEIDPVVIDVAQRYFGLPDDERIRVVNKDARRFVQESSAKYDVVIVDCYYADSLPSHLTTREFLAEAKARMEPDGVLAYNVISSVSGDGSKLFRSMYRTASGTWRRLWVFPIGIGESGDTAQRRNVIVLATDSATRRGDAALAYPCARGWSREAAGVPCVRARPVDRHRADERRARAHRRLRPHRLAHRSAVAALLRLLDLVERCRLDRVDHPSAGSSVRACRSSRSSSCTWVTSSASRSPRGSGSPTSRSPRRSHASPSAASLRSTNFVICWSILRLRSWRLYCTYESTRTLSSGEYGPRCDVGHGDAVGVRDPVEV